MKLITGIIVNDYPENINHHCFQGVEIGSFE